MEWLVLCSFIIIVGIYEKWARTQVSRLNNSVDELDDMGRRIVKDNLID
jgi:hypothetical protein